MGRRGRSSVTLVLLSSFLVLLPSPRYPHLILDAEAPLSSYSLSLCFPSASRLLLFCFSSASLLLPLYSLIRGGDAHLHSRQPHTGFTSTVYPLERCNALSS